MAAVPLRRQGILEKRREDVRRIDSMTVKVTRVSGRVLVVGAGEASVDIEFPIVFCEMPIFNFGAALADGHSPLAGSFPTISAVVSTWEIEGAGPGVTGRYTACGLAIVAGGQEDQQMWLHYSFEGKAIRNPLNALDTADDTL